MYVIRAEWAPISMSHIIFSPTRVVTVGQSMMTDKNIVIKSKPSVAVLSLNVSQWIWLMIYDIIISNHFKELAVSF